MSPRHVTMVVTNPSPHGMDVQLSEVFVSTRTLHFCYLSAAIDWILVLWSLSSGEKTSCIGRPSGDVDNSAQSVKFNWYVSDLLVKTALRDSWYPVDTGIANTSSEMY